MDTRVSIKTSAAVRITRIRYRTKKVCIFFGHRVNLERCTSDPTDTLVVKVPAKLINPTNFDVGETWAVHGPANVIKRSVPGLKYPITDTQITAQDAQLLKPSGRLTIQWLVDNVTGIGPSRADKLWTKHSDRLNKVLDAGDHDAIASIVRDENTRNELFEKWAEYGVGDSLRYLQDRGVPLELGRKVLKFHGCEAEKKLTEDPYRLLSFNGEWNLVDKLARKKFAVTLDDPRRLSAALEEALYGGLKNGHTCQSFNDTYKAARALLAPSSQPQTAFEEALRLGKAEGQFVVSEQEELMLHASGTFIMERRVAEFIRNLLKARDHQWSLLPVDLDTLISEFEQAERQALELPTFELNSAQIMAVKTSFNQHFSIITGRAGVGKTTVLKALYKALDALNRPRFQMALSGRAAARMVEATHEPATTIAGFLANVTANQMGPSPVVVIDEASMLDLVTFYRLTNKLPPDTHLILVGDPYQLPPIGAGLVFHLLCEMPGIPVTELTVVKRQSSDSGIPQAAKSIRDGIWPELPKSTESDVVFIPCADGDIRETVMSLYEEDPENTQILCGVKRNGINGVYDINQECHSRYAAGRKSLLVLNEFTGELEQSGFKEGDLLLYTANDWARGLQNGSLGHLESVFDEPRQVNIGSEEQPNIQEAIALAEFDGTQQYIQASDIDYLELAYAITVHKSQGSQFERVIIPVRQSLVLDRTFVYTAVTRAKRQVILVGDENAARRAVEAPPRAFERQVGLRALLAA